MINEVGRMKEGEKAITNAGWVWVEILHAMAIVAVPMAVVRHLGQRLVEWMVVSIILSGPGDWTLHAYVSVYGRELR